ncbi:MAG: DUF2202 domain-containing protein [Bacillota bacterium]|nr:DUF2202 domain-containing protein [Bacillota bacterium]
MKNIKIILTLTLVLIVGLSGLAYADDFGAEGAAADESWTIEEMLEYAIEDEYMAKAEYEALIEEFGNIRPFTNIIKAEQRHIEMLLPLFEKYELEIPVDDAADRAVLTETLEETFAIGVEAEIKNIDMYKAFLETDLPEDIELTFERLMRASESHLRAFERNDGGTVVLGNSDNHNGERNFQRGNRNNGNNNVRRGFSNR